MKRNKSSRLIAILCAIVMFAEQIWGSGLYVNAAGETDATTVSEAQQDQTDETAAEEPAPEEDVSEENSTDDTVTEDAPAPVTDQDNEEKKDEAAPEEETSAEESTTSVDDSATSNEAFTDGDVEEEVAVDNDEIDVEEISHNAPGDISGVGNLTDGVLTIFKEVDILGGTGSQLTAAQKNDVVTLKFVEGAQTSKIQSGFLQGSTSLETVDLTNADKLTVIGGSVNNKLEYASFANCDKLTTVKLNKVQTIEKEAFRDCDLLESIELTDRIGTIGEKAFYDCDKLAKVTIDTINIGCGDAVFGAEADSKTHHVEGISEIRFDEDAISDESGVYVPAGLFKKARFADVTIKIQDFVKGIGVSAFEESNIKKIRIEGGESLSAIRGNAFKKCKELVRLDYTGCDGKPDGIYFSNYLTQVDAETFSECISVERIDLNKVDMIGNKAFYGCTALTDLKLSADVEVIGSSVFEGCKSLPEVTIPETLSVIGEKEFYDCLALNRVYFSVPIKGDINRIGTQKDYSTYGAFETKLKEIRSQAFAVSTVPRSGNLVGGDYTKCNDLEEFIIPDSVTTLGRGVFQNCAYLKYVHISNRITKIDNSTFSYCLWLGSGEREIDKVARYSYEGKYRITGNDVEIIRPIPTGGDIIVNLAGAWPLLKTVVAVNSNTTVDAVQAALDTAEENRDNTQKTIVESIGVTIYYILTSESGELEPDEKDFYDHVVSILDLETVQIDETWHVQADPVRDTILFSYDAALIPENVTEIGDNAFEVCLDYRLNENSTLPAALQKIGTKAFSNCQEIEQIIIPKHVTKIGSRAFENCMRANSVIIESSQIKGGEWGVFSDCTHVKDVRFGRTKKDNDGKLLKSEAGLFILDDFPGNPNPENYKAEEEPVTEIPVQLFSACDFNESVRLVIPKTVTTIKKEAFAGKEEIAEQVLLQQIVFETGCRLETIENGAFQYCTQLTVFDGIVDDGKETDTNITDKTKNNLVIPSTVTTIGEKAFYGCKAMLGITIPVEVTKVGKSAFAECNALAVVYLKAREMETGVVNREDEGLFYHCGIKYIFIGQEAAVFPDYLFYGASFSKSSINPNEYISVDITIRRNVKRIGAYSLCNVVNLNKVTVESGSALESVGASAFKGCTALTFINLPDTVKNIENNAFSGCVKLHFSKEDSDLFNIPENAEQIEKAAFKSTSINEIVLPKGIIKIDDETFMSSDLKKVTINGVVTEIGTSAFENCKGLTEIEIPYGNEVIGSRAFMNCENLEKVVLPDTVKSIGTDAFTGCAAGLTFWISKNFDKSILPAGAKTHEFGYSISYELDDGVNAPHNPSGFDADHDDIKLEDPEREGSVFLGWYEVRTGEAPNYVFDKKIEVIKKGDNRDLTLYARWKDQYYSITYVLWGGINAPENPSEFSMWTPDITLKDPTLEGSKFEGWYRTLEDLKSKKNKVVVIPKGTKEDITLYASWNGWKFADAPVASIETGTSVLPGTKVKLYTSTPGAVIYYVVADGDKDPGEVVIDAEHEYKGGITIDRHMRIKAVTVAQKNKYYASEPAEFYYELASESTYWGEVLDEEDQQMWKNPINVPANIWVAGVPEFVEYTGEAIVFDNIRVYDHKTLLTEGVDYSISYKNNKKVATKNDGKKAPAVIVKGKGSYSDKVTVFFTIREVKKIASNPGAVSIKKSEVTLGNQVITYSNRSLSANDVGLRVVSAGKHLIENEDYIVVFSKNKVGKATVIVKGIGGYKGKIKKKFTINAADISKATVELLDDSGNVISVNKTKKAIYSYVKGGATPQVRVTIDGKILVKGVDYTLSYKNNAPGNQNSVTGTVNVNGKKNYTGTHSKTNFDVVKANMADVLLGASGLKYSVKGISSKAMKLTVMDINGKTLSFKSEDGKPLDYTVKCTYLDQSGNEVELTNDKIVLASGTKITVTLTGLNNYNGEVSTVTTVYTNGIDKAKFKVASSEYTGKPIEPKYESITATFKGSPMAKSDYRIVGYNGNIKKGTAKVYLAGADTYGGLKTAKFKITKKKMTSN